MKTIHIFTFRCSAVKMIRDFLRCEGRLCYISTMRQRRRQTDVADLMNQILKEDYANASSRHVLGRKSRTHRKCPTSIERAFYNAAGNGRLYFQCDGSQQFGAVFYSKNYLKGNKPLNVVTTKIEHPSVYEAIRQIFVTSEHKSAISEQIFGEISTWNTIEA